MFNRTSFIVKHKAKRYKQWLEKVKVYPYPVEISGRNYYLIDYVKLKQPVASSIVSDEEEVLQDAMKAHQRLYLFYRILEKIRDEGRMRANVNFDFFRVPMAKMDDHQDTSYNWDKPYAFIKRLLGYQLNYRKTYDDFWAHVEEKKEKNKPLTDESIELAIYTAAKLETIQYHVVLELSQNIDLLQNWRKQMEEAELWKQLKREQQVFYIQLMENGEVMKEEAKNVKHAEFEQALKINQKQMAAFMKKEQKADESILRYPG